MYVNLKLVFYLVVVFFKYMWFLDVNMIVRFYFYFVELVFIYFYSIKYVFSYVIVNYYIICLWLIEKLLS